MDPIYFVFLLGILVMFLVMARSRMHLYPIRSKNWKPKLLPVFQKPNMISPPSTRLAVAVLHRTLTKPPSGSVKPPTKAKSMTR